MKNKYPLPLIGELWGRFGKATMITKLDLKNDYYIMRILKGEE